MTGKILEIKRQVENIVKLQDRLDEQVKQIHHLIRHNPHCATLLSTIDSTRRQVQELAKGIEEIDKEARSE